MAEKTRRSDRAPRTEDQIREATVGELRPMTSRIDIADYDPEWPRLFDREAQRIRAVLGDRVLQLEHIGSTSVPGLPAKPIIDMLLVIADSADEAAYVPALEAAGYVMRLREPDWHEHRLFKGPDTDVNLHVFSAGSPEIERDLIFRNRLRTNEADRELYLRTKRDLAQRDWRYAQNYADAKSPLIDEIIERARRSAQR
jgi:GrpB-like predicted nucleotidyltransferase (UPF0157 family)